MPATAFKTGREFQPVYLRLYDSGELNRRVERAVSLLESCTACPRNCRVNRLEDKFAVCRTGRYAVVSSYNAHHGEEECLRGWRGSGTIFFSGCNLRCVFCQNFDISWQLCGTPAPPEKLARMMLELQSDGCHNINLVTPEHIVPQILEALVFAVEWGLNIPLVYNTSAYDSLETLGWLDGVVDVYMPDFKCWSPARARTYLKAEDYPTVARAAIRAMHRQVGHLAINPDGLATRGLLLRHLALPDSLEDTRAILEWIAAELGPATYLNLMGQYRPAGRVSPTRYPELARPIRGDQLAAAFGIAEALGLERLDRARRPRDSLHVVVGR